MSRAAVAEDSKETDSPTLRGRKPSLARYEPQPGLAPWAAVPVAAGISA